MAMDLRRDSLAVRKATLASLLSGATSGLRFNEHMDMDEADGSLVFAHACKMGLEGIVSKRRDLFYRSGRSPHWIKSKNPNADLRGTAITQMLNRGVPAHKVAARHGHDPAIMLRAYAKAMPQRDVEAAKIMGDVLKGVL
jgi:hypothetical protein